MALACCRRPAPHMGACPKQRMADPCIHPSSRLTHTLPHLWTPKCHLGRPRAEPCTPPYLAHCPQQAVPRSSPTGTLIFICTPPA